MLQPNQLFSQVESKARPNCIVTAHRAEARSPDRATPPRLLSRYEERQAETFPIREGLAMSYREATATKLAAWWPLPRTMGPPPSRSTTEGPASTSPRTRPSGTPRPTLPATQAASPASVRSGRRSKTRRIRWRSGLARGRNVREVSPVVKRRTRDENQVSDCRSNEVLKGQEPRRSG